MDVVTFSESMGRALPLARYAALLPAWNAALIAAGATTVNRVAMVSAQVGHESVGLKYMQEIASGAAYEGRKDLGNVIAGDGVRFRGHGPLQITGRANHLAVSKWAHSKGYVPTATYFVDHPTELCGDRYGFMGVVWYWVAARPRLNALADAGDLEGATRLVNGGLNGLADRATRWKRCLALGTRLLPTQEDELSQEYERDSRARWGKEDLLDRDLRGDLANKQKQLDRIEAGQKALAAALTEVAARITLLEAKK